MQKFKRIGFFFYMVLGIFSFCVSSGQAGRQSPSFALQWEVSQPTGLHQVFLIFKKDRVNMFTNTSFWQDESKIRLGYFTFKVNQKWKMEREKIENYLSRLKERPPVKTADLLSEGSLPKAIEEFIQEDSHASVEQLSGYKIRAGDSYFDNLKEVFTTIGETRWSCVDCVIYRPHPKGIERERISKDGSTSTIVFSKEELDCYSINEELLECTDTHDGPEGRSWGSFRIKL